VHAVISFVVVMMLAGASLEGQGHGAPKAEDATNMGAGPRGSSPDSPAPAPAKPVVPPAAAKPGVAPAPVQVAPAAGAHVGQPKPPAAPAKPDAHAAAGPAKPGAPVPAAQAAQPAKSPVKSLGQAAESTAAALAASRRRSSRAASARPSGSAAGAEHAPAVKRYSLFWPPDDTVWRVQWPIITGRVALQWDDQPETVDQPASH
jgi:hypothetical protein